MSKKASSLTYQSSVVKTKRMSSERERGSRYSACDKSEMMPDLGVLSQFQIQRVSNVRRSRSGCRLGGRIHW